MQTRSQTLNHTNGPVISTKTSSRGYTSVTYVQSNQSLYERLSSTSVLSLEAMLVAQNGGHYTRDISVCAKALQNISNKLATVCLARSRYDRVYGSLMIYKAINICSQLFHHMDGYTRKFTNAVFKKAVELRDSLDLMNFESHDYHGRKVTIALRNALESELSTTRMRIGHIR